MIVLNAALLAVYSLLLLGAAIQDLRWLRISNVFSVSLLLSAIALLILVVKPDAWWQHVVSFVALLTIGAFAFTRGWFGGGDVKIAAAAATLFNLQQLLWFVVATTMIGGLLTLFLLLVRSMLSLDTKISWLGLQRKRAVPYGVAVAAGAILVAVSVIPVTPQEPAPRHSRTIPTKG